MNSLAEEGVAIIMVSSELPEILGMRPYPGYA
jgi:ABC-type sugar transport system ATPase subunit